MLDSPRAVLFDYDGTLVDTEPIWAHIEQTMLAQRGLSFDAETIAGMRGQSAWLTAQMLCAAFKEPWRVAAVHAELHDKVADHIATHDLPFLPGGRELLAELANIGVPAAIVTASNAQVVAAAADRLPTSLRFIVTADDVSELKPDPEGYLQAMARLGVAAHETVIVEDSVPGITAALATGAVVLAVRQPDEVLNHPRLAVCETGLAGVDFAALSKLWRERKSVL